MLNLRLVTIYLASLTAMAMSTSAQAAVPPDITIQAAQCIAPGSPSDAQLKSFIDSALSSAQAQSNTAFTNPSSVVACVNQRETVGIWFAHSATVDDLAGVDILSAEPALLAMRMSPAAENASVNASVNAQLSALGQGLPFRIKGFDLAYTAKPKETVKLTVHVSQTQYGLTVHGSDTLTDTIAFSPSGVPSCSTLQHFGYSAAIADTIASLFVNVLVSVYIEGEAAEQGGESTYGVPQQPEGVGCAFISLVPTTILTPAIAGDPNASPPTAPTPPGKLLFGWRNFTGNAPRV